jgi:hypothetical protein
MHVHANQVNPYAQLDAMYAAQKAASKRAAEQTRRKLSEFASALAGDADSEACVVRIGAHEQSEEPERRQPQPGNGQKRERREATEEADGAISDWA